MILRKKKLLAGFLEKDNLKLIVYEGRNRVFAGQITFAPEILRDAFIVDGAKFSAQVKMSFAQKMTLRDVAEVVLFLPPDKTFTKTMATADAIDGFIQSLPYFREELIINSQRVDVDKSRVTHVAFEKKLVEDLERPFLETGKTIQAVRSAVFDLVSAWPKEGEYLLLVPFEKETAFAVGSDGGILEASEFKTDVFVTRFGEYVANHNLGHIKNAYTVGTFPAELAEKLHQANNLTIESLVSGDVYDQVVAGYLGSSQSGLGSMLGKLPGVSRKNLFLGGAILIGFLLVAVLVKGSSRFTKSTVSGPKVDVISPVASPSAKVVEAKPADFLVRVLNGTLVEGEAGRAAGKIKEKGFEIKETKNATSSAFVATKLRVATGVPENIVAMVKTVLQESYQTVVVEGLVDESVKMEVIVGKKK